MKKNIKKFYLPINRKISDIVFISAKASAFEEFGLNAFMTSPIKNTKEGKPNPVKHAQNKPT